MAGSGKQLSAAQLEHLRRIASLGGKANAARHGGWAAAHAARNARGTKAPVSAAARVSVSKATAAAGAGNSPNRTDLTGRVAGTTNGTRSSGVQSPKLSARIASVARRTGGVAASTSKANARIIKAFGLPKGTVLVRKDSSLPGTGDAAPNSKKAVAAAKKAAAVEKKAATVAAKATAAAVKAVRATSNAGSAVLRATMPRATTTTRARPRASSSVATYLKNLRARAGG